MRKTIYLATAAITGLAVMGLGAATASAASAQPSDPSVIRIKGPVVEIPGWWEATLPRFQCPSNYPYSWNRDLAPHRIVPPGTEVIEPGGVGVIMSQFTSTQAPGGTAYISGHTSNSSNATNWTWDTKELQIYYNCTNDVSQAAKFAGGS